MNLPEKCLVDTNVPKMANRGLVPDAVPLNERACVQACIDAIIHITENACFCLVTDDTNEIFNEYLQNLNMKGQPGVGDRFMKWVFHNCWTPPKGERVTINKNNNSYKEFPDTTKYPGLKNFDLSDRKFVAVANAHCKKPPILQATDSKWWGWKNELDRAGITVLFLCEKYIEAKYKDKIGE